MSYIDPDSFFDRGTDSHGVIVELGGTDTDGHFVGFIDSTGHAWQSRREHDTAITAGRFRDAWIKYNRTGGIIGTAPDPEQFAIEYAHPENLIAATNAAREVLEDMMPGGIFHRSIVAYRQNVSGLN